jgi:hypothetical protein
MDGVNGYLLPINPSSDFVVSRITSIDKLNVLPNIAVSHLTWDRITKLTYSDLQRINNPGVPV